MDGINKVIKVPFDGINSALKKIRDISIMDIQPFKNLIKLIDVPQIPQLYEGTVLEKGKVGLLEGNGAEAVVPLHNNKKWISAVANDMKDAIDTNSLHNDIKSQIDYNTMFNAFKKALKDVKVVMNDREFGAFVTDTIERVVYD